MEEGLSRQECQHEQSCGGPSEAGGEAREDAEANWWEQGRSTILSVTSWTPRHVVIQPDPPCPLCPLPQFRLKRCGLERRVYLVEEHGSVHNLSLPESTLLQAVTNTQVSREGRARQAGAAVVHGSWSGPGTTFPLLGPLPQVIDGFFVKRTADIKESAAYLALLTRGLQRLYQVSRGPCPSVGTQPTRNSPCLGPVHPQKKQGR